MINDPALMALIQARRQYNARDPGSIITRGPDPVGPPIPVDPPPVAPPQPSAADRAVNRGALMQNYMRTMGLTPMRYGANNVRTGNMSLGSDGPGRGPQQGPPGTDPTKPTITGDEPPPPAATTPPPVTTPPPPGGNAPPPGGTPPPSDGKAPTPAATTNFNYLRGANYFGPPRSNAPPPSGGPADLAGTGKRFGVI